MVMRKIGQSSVEYLFVVVLALTLILPASFLFFDFSKSSEGSVISAQIDRTGNEILSSAEQVYVIGNGSRVTLELTLPETLTSVKIYDEAELVFKYFAQSGESEAVFFSDVNIALDTSRCDAITAPTGCDLLFKPGVNTVQISSRGDYVSLKVN